MNIWIVNHYAIPPSMGGLVRHYYFSKYLQKKGHRVKIFTSSRIHNTDINMIKDGALYKEEMMDEVEYTFVRSWDYKGNGLDRIWNMIDMPFQMWKAMRCFYKKQRPDVIYTSSPDLFVAFFALVFGKMHRIPVIVEVRDLWPESIVEYNHMSRRNPIIQTLYWLEKWIYKRADRIIFTIPGGKDYIQEKRWSRTIDLNKIFHINNGVDLEEFEYNKKNYRIEDEDLENGSYFKIIYVGSIRLVNHLRELVDVAEILKRKGEDRIVFLIYGEGTEKEQLQKLCAAKKLNVKFKGKVDKKYVPYILSKSDLNVINVRNTGLSSYGCSWNKLFEYIASERPILCNSPQKYDLIRENGLGVSEVFETPAEYGKRILDLAYMSEDKYNEIVERAGEVKQQYDYKKLTEKLEEILKQVVRGKAKGRV